MQALLVTAAVVFLAELGDKTQLVTMACVAKFGRMKVFLGASAAALVNSALAVILGDAISRVIPISTLQVAAGLGFLGFGLWSLRGDEDEETEEQEKDCTARNPVWAVFIAFFIAELGDKTQLVTLSLAAGQQNPFAIWAGASAGLIMAQGISIFLSGLVFKYIPPKFVAYAAAAIFFVFGSLTLYQNIPGVYLTPVTIGVYSFTLALLIYLATRKKNLP